MKKSLYLLLSCILLCGAIMLSGCNVNININPAGSTDEQTSDEVTQEQTSDEVTQDQIEESIIGRWIVTDRNGHPALTNWTALRADEDGNTYTASFEMTRVTE